MKLGELFAGYGGLGMAVEEVFGAELAWVSEFEEAPSKILAHHWPHAPNHGDITKINWRDVEPVDIISGGSPCQDLSLAGKRRGMQEGTRSNLFESMCEAVEIIRPKYVIWENVRGALSAGAISEMEQRAGRVGDDGNPHLRALGRVLGNMADLGYDAEWRGLTASNVGATHGRFRVFLLASLSDAGGVGLEAGRLPRRPVAEVPEPANHQSILPDTHSLGRERSGEARNGRHGPADDCEPTADAHSRHDDGRLNDSQRDAEQRKATPWSGEGIGVAADTASLGRPEWRTEPAWLEGRSNALISSGQNWGEYGPAVRRWERINGPAPRPTEPTGRDGAHRLSPAFVEWMMGLPAGWVTDVPGVNRNAQLKALGNGVVPQQAAAALRDMLAAFEAKEIAA